MAPCARLSTAVLPSWVPISCSISSPTISCASPSSSPLEAGVCPKTKIAPKARGKSNKTTRTASIFNVFQQTARRDSLHRLLSEGLSLLFGLSLVLRKRHPFADDFAARLVFRLYVKIL